MPQNEDSQSPPPSMQGYREVLEFRALARYHSVRITLIEVGRKVALFSWVMHDGDLTADFALQTRHAERGIPGRVDLQMEANSMHFLRDAGRRNAYRIAARAYAAGRMTHQDLANIGIGLTSEQREEIGLSVLSEMAS